MNFIAGHVDSTGPQGRFSFEGGQLDLPCPSAVRATLGLRPEHLQLQADSPWRGQVQLVEPTGADTFVAVQTVAGTVTVRVAPHTPVRVGEAIGLAASAAHANWFDPESGRRLT